MHIINMSVLKIPGGVDFTKYILSAIVPYVQWLKIGKVKKFEENRSRNAENRA